MSILGVESIVYGVDDLEKCTRFYDDFGLPQTRSDDAGTDYRLEDGSSVLLRGSDDPSLPAPYCDGPCVRETIWGVDTQASLDALEADLAGDREITRDADGTIHVVDDVGIPIGFRLFDRRKVSYTPPPVNAPDNIGRMNQHRKWYKRAQPKIIAHVVYNTPEPDKGAAFYMNRLKFRLSDISRPLGVFLRADGRNDHHNIFFFRDEKPKWHHVCYGLEDIDEIMVGGNHMSRQGWNSQLGLGRHRIASALFYYIDCPAGGEAEYQADSDYLDDRWVPREWEAMFGAFSWVGRVPEFVPHEVEWDVRVVGDYKPE